jgi:hypothetical protein
MIMLPMYKGKRHVIPLIAVLATLIILFATFSSGDGGSMGKWFAVSIVYILVMEISLGFGLLLLILRFIPKSGVGDHFLYRYFAVMNFVLGLIGIILSCAGLIQVAFYIIMFIVLFILGFAMAWDAATRENKVIQVS